MRVITLTALLSLAALAAVSPALAQDGAANFNGQCKSCHTLTGTNGPAGPSLKGVVGRKLAGSPGYAYSKALVAKGGAWTEASLNAYLSGPAAFAPGGKMFTRVADPKARAALIAFLKTQR
jgi:cytochrome c2